MNALELNTKYRAVLTATKLLPDASNPGKTITDAYPCNLQGARLGSDEKPVPVYKDLYSGKTYALVAENIPSATDKDSLARAAEIQALNPIHFVNDDGSVKGWFIEAPSFDESQAPVSAAA